MIMTEIIGLVATVRGIVTKIENRDCRDLEKRNVMLVKIRVGSIHIFGH